MKKLMFIAAAAAMTSVFGVTVKDAQVYQMRIAARTTQFVESDKVVTTNDNPFVDGNYVAYRDTTQYVLNGLIWGCSCDSILGNYTVQQNLGTDSAKTNAYNGAMVWIPKTMQFVFGTDQAGTLGWNFINAIGKTGNKCEGCFQIWAPGGCENDVWGSLTFAGFGTLGRTSAVKNSTSVSNCTYYVNSISGNFAGYLPAPTYKPEDIDCTYCTEKQTFGCIPAPAWAWCACGDVSAPTLTAAYGEWYIRYSASMSAALRNAKHVGQVYDFGGRRDDNDVWVNYVKRFIKVEQ